MDALAGRPFAKMNGLGNEIVVLDLRGADIAVTPAQARAMAKAPLFKGLWGVQMMSSYVPPEAWRAFYDAGLPLVHGVFDQFPANEVTTYTTFREDV